MKKATKMFSLALAAVMLVTATVFGTMAYLTSTDEVVNTFTVGNVEITLDEAKVDINGSSVEGAARVQENSYKLLPGHRYNKDPTVHVDTDSEDCYLFVKVEDGLAAIEGEETVATQMTENGWNVVDAANGIYVYGTVASPTSIKAGENKVVFDSITVKGDVDNDTLAAYAGKTITVNAYAIQADGFAGKTASEIWTAAGFDN